MVAVAANEEALKPRPARPGSLGVGKVQGGRARASWGHTGASLAVLGPWVGWELDGHVTDGSGILRRVSSPIHRRFLVKRNMNVVSMLTSIVMHRWVTIS